MHETIHTTTTDSHLSPPQAGSLSAEPPAEGGTGVAGNDRAGTAHAAGAIARSATESRADTHRAPRPRVPMLLFPRSFAVEARQTPNGRTIQLTLECGPCAVGVRLNPPKASALMHQLAEICDMPLPSDPRSATEPRADTHRAPRTDELWLSAEATFGGITFTLADVERIQAPGVGPASISLRDGTIIHGANDDAMGIAHLIAERKVPAR